MIRIGNSRLAARVAPRGAETRGFALDGHELLWPGDATVWPEQAPILFPIVGRAEGGRVAMRGREVTMPIHGFARHEVFETIERGAEHCRHRLSASASTRVLYPFDFTLTIEHRVLATSLRITATVENRDDEPMPFGFGFHPGLSWPLPGLAGQEHELVLENGAEPAALLLDGGLVAGPELASPFAAGRLAVSDAAFAADDSIVIAERWGGALRYGTADGRGLRLRAEGLPQLVLWHPPGAGFLCIEPWQGLPARKGAGPGLADRPHTLLLNPGESRCFTLTLDAGALV